MRKYLKSNLKKIVPEKFHLKVGTNYRKLKSKFYRNDLTALAKIYQSDKWGRHSYTPKYQFYFEKLKNQKLNILELGIGGYDDPKKGGASLRMWKAFFHRSQIFGVDLHSKKGIEENRIITYQGDQGDEKFLREVVKKIGPLDIIIDDGSHRNEHIINSFKVLFPLLKKNGIYVVEDIQTSYWPEFNGSSEDMEASWTAVNYFKSFVHGLNHVEFLKKNYKPSYFDEAITGIHFYHNLIFIEKGDNTEKSNIIVNNEWPY